MSKPKFTPGPWQYSKFRASIKAGSKLVGIFHDKNGMDVAKADAQLITIAPELYASHKALYALVKRYLGPTIAGGELTEARRLIARVEGVDQ